ncbi:methyltransferase family protein [Povalibacter sp.]|uniref:methyltransferase family protein n=1 Tax=Povalibacter sp. TaxID=1962978 RepID=UPI002F40815C
MLSPERILQTSFAFRASKMLLSAVELGVFTELAKGPRSLRQLCHTLGLNECAARQWLDALVCLGFLGCDGPGEHAIYLNTREASLFLDRNSAAYVGASLEQTGGQIYARWDALIAALRTDGDLDAWRSHVEVERG